MHTAYICKIKEENLPKLSIYRIWRKSLRTQERVRLIHGKRAIGIRATEVLLYQALSEKKSTLKKKTTRYCSHGIFLGVNSSILGQTHFFAEGRQNKLTELPYLKVYPFAMILLICNAQNGCLCHIDQMKAQISLCFRAVCSVPSVHFYKISGYCKIDRRTRTNYICLCRCAERSEPFLLGYG